MHTQHFTLCLYLILGGPNWPLSKPESWTRVDEVEVVLYTDHQTVEDMDADAIRIWSERYDEAYDDNLQAIENHINEELTEQQYLTRDQLEDVVRWKLNGMPGRREGNVDRVRTVSDEFIRRISEASFLVNDPTVQLKTLTAIPGIGAATASVILAFYDPENYGIGDRYIIDEFFGEDRTMRATDYPTILAELRNRNPGDFDCRTVEKAYYQKYRVENNVGDW